MKYGPGRHRLVLFEEGDLALEKESLVGDVIEELEAVVRVRARARAGVCASGRDRVQGMKTLDHKQGNRNDGNPKNDTKSISQNICSY
jgi:hypothetical protein